MQSNTPCALILAAVLALIGGQGAYGAGEEGQMKSGKREKLPESDVSPRLVPQGCSASQTRAVENARRAAAIRSQNASFQVNGVVPYDPDVARLRARSLVFDVFGESLNMDQVAEIVSQIRDTLTSASLRVACEPASDSNCGSRAGYVVNYTQPIHLCPAFFKSSSEDRIRTMAHEAAHVAGIGEDGPESYCPVFDCQTSCGGFYVADGWSHYIHCVSGQTPDTPPTITP